jgi:hypothetical protein
VALALEQHPLYQPVPITELAQQSDVPLRKARIDDPAKRHGWCASISAELERLSGISPRSITGPTCTHARSVEIATGQS